MARKAQDQVGDLTTVVEESVLGIRIVKGFGRHRSQARAFRALSQTAARPRSWARRGCSPAIWALIITIPELAIGAALVLGTVQVADGELSAGTLVAFLSTALALRWPVESIGFLLAMSQEAATATERYFEVMDAAGGGRTRPAPAVDGVRGAPPGCGSRASVPLPGRARRARRPSSPAIDLHIRPGETMALVGATGSGKTTLTALVPRLHEVTAGRITLDGEDIADDAARSGCASWSPWPSRSRRCSRRPSARTS